MITKGVFELTESTGAFGYRILVDGVVKIMQTFKPGAEGFQNMTEAEANQYADADIVRMSE